MDWKRTNEVGILIKVSDRAESMKNMIGKPIVQVDPRYFRPSEVESLLGDASKARKALGWEPKNFI